MKSQTLSGALVAAVGPAFADAHLAERLERLRLNAGQQACTEVHPGLGIAALAHPVIAQHRPFRPFASAAAGRYLGIVHGRIDNLAEIGGMNSTGPAQWALDRWLGGGAEAITALAGPFVLVIADRRERTLALIRDPLGDRSVFYARHADSWWVATEEAALWPPRGDLRLNPQRIAEFFAIEYPAPGSTFFKGIDELPPAHTVTLIPGESPHPRRYWQFAYQPEVARMAPPEAAENLVRLLGQAVAAQVDDAGPTAIAVSGGMDSPALAALAPAAADTRLYTYHTPGFPESDETAFARSLADRLDKPLRAVLCDRHWPLSESFSTPAWLVHDPGADAYRAMRFELIRAAVDDRCRVMLTGDFGDHMYAGNHYWLKDLFIAGQWTRALRHLGRRLQRHGIGGLRSDPPMRRIMPLVGINRGRRYAREWLTSGANALLSPGTRDHPYLGRIADVDRIEGCINNFSARLGYLGHLQGLLWGVELRVPFRDRRLLEFALSLPAHYLYEPDRGVTKALMRRALRDRVPASIIERRGKTSFEPLFRHGLLDAHRRDLEGLLAGEPDWRRFVRAEWLATPLRDANWTDLSLSVLWHCAAFSLWRRHLGRGAAIDSGPPIG